MNSDFDMDNKLNFEILNIKTDGPNNIYNKILDGTVKLTDEILVLLIILNITEYCETYSDLYNTAYESINNDNTIIREMYYSFYYSVIPQTECYNVMTNCYIYWLYKLCVSENEIDNNEIITNNFLLKYKSLQLKFLIKKLFNYDTEFVDNKLFINCKNNNITNNNIKIGQDTYNLFVETCAKLHNGDYNNL